MRTFCLCTAALVAAGRVHARVLHRLVRGRREGQLHLVGDLGVSL